MQYILGDSEISFEVFEQSFPEEAKVLEGFILKGAALVVTENRISLNYGEYKNLWFPLQKKLDYHKRFFNKHSLYKDPLAKALGIKKGKSRPTVIDATGGALNDSMLILSYGVTNLKIFERNPIVACLASNALKNLKGFKGEFFYGDATKVKDLEKSDVVYFDPMYESRASKTAPKKEMAIFREVVKDDEDKVEIARQLFSLAKERVVIKRSNKNIPLLEKPDFTIEGKSTCYDVYLV